MAREASPTDASMPVTEVYVTLLHLPPFDIDDFLFAAIDAACSRLFSRLMPMPMSMPATIDADDVIRHAADADAYFIDTILMPSPMPTLIFFHDAAACLRYASPA